ncbi:MAG: ABC transporter permease [bacterium]
MRYFSLIWASITRKKTRLILTIGSFAVALFLFGLLITIHTAFYQGLETSEADRLIIRSKISLIMLLPYSYKEKIKQIEGVRAITSGTYFGGVYQNERNFFPQFAIEADNYLDIYPEFIVPEDQWEEFKKDRQGCVVGKGLVERFGWEIGDRVPLQGTAFPGAWEFNICGIYEGSRKEDDLSQFWFHYKYLEERSQIINGEVGWYVVKVANPEKSLAITQKIDEIFTNSPDETKTEPEAMFAASFVKQFGNINLILLTIGGVVLFTLLLVTGSTMAISVRERTGELAILKTLGYSNILLLLLVLSESITYALIGGGVGIGMAKLFTLRGDPTHGMLPLFYLSPFYIAIGLCITLIIGFFSGLIPAVNAMGLRIVEALRRV